MPTTDRFCVDFVRSLRACAVRVAMCALVAHAAAAQSAPGPAPVADRFSLADALAAARGGHPALRAAGGRRQSAVGQARQDAAFVNPIVEYRRENIGGPVRPDEFLTASLGADVYGRRYALRGIVGAVTTRAAADSAVAARSLEYDVARAYWRAALAAALRDVADVQRRDVDSLALVQVRRAREGAIAEGAAMRTQLEADRTRLAAATARADAERAHGDLARALARPLDEVPWPTDGIDPPVAVPMPRTAARPVAFAPGPASPVAAAAFPANATAEDLSAAALRQRPEVVAARARLAEAQRRAQAERLGALPGLGAVGGYKRTSGYNTGVLGVFVSVPLFDRNQGARARASGDLIAAENDLRTQEAQITAEVEASARAYATLLAEGPPDGTGGAGRAAALNARGREVAAVTAVAYREGAATLLELLDAVRSRADVQIAALRWAADLRLARLDLDRATGVAAGLPTTPTR